MKAFVYEDDRGGMGSAVPSPVAEDPDDDDVRLGNLLRGRLDGIDTDSVESVRELREDASLE